MGLYVDKMIRSFLVYFIVRDQFISSTGIFKHIILKHGLIQSVVDFPAASGTIFADFYSNLQHIGHFLVYSLCFGCLVDFCKHIFMEVTEKIL